MSKNKIVSTIDTIAKVAPFVLAVAVSAGGFLFSQHQKCKDEKSKSKKNELNKKCLKN